MTDPAPIVEFRPTPNQYAFTFGGAEPVLTVTPGTVLRVWSDDAFCSAIGPDDSHLAGRLDPARVNPQTGPFHVEGAERGDTVAIHLVTLEPARDYGVSAIVPHFGGLTSTTDAPTLQDPLPDLVWIYHLDPARQSMTYRARHSDHAVRLPVEPMLGTLAVAPAAGEVRSSLVPDRFGGNLDTPFLRAGTTCYLGVNVPGALFSLGDGHYRQGDAEACGTAVEGPMITTLIVDLLKGRAPATPRLETDDLLISVGSGRPLEDAWRIAQHDLAHWLTELLGLHPLDAYQLLSQIVRAPIANVVDPNHTITVAVAKALIPPLQPYDDIHIRLRRAADRLAKQPHPSQIHPRTNPMTDTRSSRTRRSR
jgi:acetamidase/formamidase